VLAEGKAGELDAPPPIPVGELLPAVEQAFTEVEVDSMVERDPNSAAPVYPPELLSRRVEGSTFVNYVVDTTGRVDTTTIRVIRTSHQLFARSVRSALALMRFRPAIQSSRKVRQWVEQNFAFRIVRPTPTDTT
jgi:TonB family protein